MENKFINHFLGGTMTKRRIIGGAITAIGVFLLVYAIRSWRKIEAAKGITDDIGNFFSHNPSLWDPMIEFFGGEAQTAVSKYDLPVLILFISSLLLITGGLVLVLRKRKLSK